MLTFRSVNTIRASENLNQNISLLYLFPNTSLGGNYFGPKSIELSLILSTNYIHFRLVLYKNIEQIPPNKLHGPMHYKIGATCVYNGQVFCTLL